jgi:hydroxymethylglutaryl-CoA lyase
VSYPASVSVTDVALRDGLQIQRDVLPTETKVELLQHLLDAGIRDMEVGSYVNPKLVPTMADSEEVYRRAPKDRGARLLVLIPNLKGAQRAIGSGVTDVRVVLSATEGHSKANTNRSVREGLTQTAAVRDLCEQAGISSTVAVATSFVCPFDGVVSIDHLGNVVEELTQMGFSEISLADTLGMANPDHVERAVATLRGRFPASEFSLHLHNTYGMGMANVMAGLRQGVRSFDAALGGIGGCPFAPGAAGNIATEDLVFMLHAVGVDTGIDIDRLATAARALRTALGSPLESAVSRALDWVA